MWREIVKAKRTTIDWPAKKKYEQESSEDEEIIVNRKRKERKFEQIRKKSCKTRTWMTLAALPMDAVAHGIMLFLDTPNLVRFGATNHYFQECFLESLPIKQLHTIPLQLRTGTPLYMVCNQNHHNLIRAHYLRRNLPPRLKKNRDKHVLTGIYWSVQYGFLSTAQDFYNHLLDREGTSITTFNTERLIPAMLGAIRGHHQDTFTWICTKFNPEFNISHGFQFFYTACERGTLDLVKRSHAIWKETSIGCESGLGMIQLALELTISNNNTQILEWLYTDPDHVHIKDPSNGLDPRQVERGMDLTGDFGKDLLQRAMVHGSNEALEWLKEKIEKSQK